MWRNVDLERGWRCYSWLVEPCSIRQLYQNSPNTAETARITDLRGFGGTDITLELLGHIGRIGAH